MPGVKAKAASGLLRPSLAGKAIRPYFIGTTILTITAKGQVTLRKEILRHLGVGPGDRIVVEPLGDGRIEVRAKQASGKISEALRCLKRDDGPSLSIDAMNAVIAEGWARRS